MTGLFNVDRNHFVLKKIPILLMLYPDNYEETHKKIYQLEILSIYLQLKSFKGLIYTHNSIFINSSKKLKYNSLLEKK